MAGERVQRREPAVGRRSFGGLDIVGAPGPTGAPIVQGIVNILERYDLGRAVSRPAGGVDSIAAGKWQATPVVPALLLEHGRLHAAPEHWDGKPQ